MLQRNDETNKNGLDFDGGGVEATFDPQKCNTTSEEHTKESFDQANRLNHGLEENPSSFNKERFSEDDHMSINDRSETLNDKKMMDRQTSAHQPTLQTKNTSNGYDIESHSPLHTFHSFSSSSADTQNPTCSTSSATTFIPKSKQKKHGNFSKMAAMALVVVLLAGSAGFVGSMIQKSFDTTPQNETSALPQTQSDHANPINTGTMNSMADVADATSNSVVEIKTESVQGANLMEQYTPAGAGSGVIIKSDGYIVTNHHVVAQSDKITVQLKNGKIYDAKLIGSDPSTDLALLKIEETNLPTAVLGDSGKMRVGDPVLAIGNPLGELGGTVTEGVISALDREITLEQQMMTLLQTSAAVNPGNSGGGLFNSKAELIGVVNAKTSAAGIEGLGFAIPSNTVRPVLEDLLQNGYVTGRIKLGVSFVDILNEQTARQYQKEEFGPYIYQIAPKSDAERGGLKMGDLVHKIGDKKVYQSSEIKQMMKDYKVGDTMELTIKRDGKEIVLKVKFSEDVSNKVQ